MTFLPTEDDKSSVMQKLAAMLKAGGPAVSGIGQGLAPQSPGGPAPGTPGRVGLAPPQMMTPPPIKFSAEGAGAAMPQPVPAPPPMPFQTQQSDMMMSKLDPKGAAAYSAIQGVSQIIGQWTQKREAKQQQEAANIAQNLMQAIKTGDQGEVAAIMNDPKAMKVINKVYKGWMTPAPQAKPQDPEVTAFTKGVTDAATGGPQITGGQATSGGGFPITNAGTPQMTGGQPQPQTGVKPSATGGMQAQGGMPRSMGGYMLPQSLPQDLLARAQANAALQRGMGDPGTLVEGSRLTSEEQRQAEIYATGLGLSPKEAAVLDAGTLREMYRGYARIATEELKQNALAQRTQELTKSRTDVARIGATSRVQAAGITGKSRTDAASIAAKAKVDAANIAKDAKGKSPDQLQLKILDSQLKSYTQLKKNADDNYEKMMKEDKPEVAQIYKQMSSGYDSQISSINTQMDDLKSVGDMSEFNKMIQDIIGPDSEATDPPEDSDASDNN